MSQSFIKKPDNGPHAALSGLGVLASEHNAPTITTREQWLEACAARFKWAGCSDFAAKDCAITEFNIRCREETLDGAAEQPADRWPDPAEAADDAMREWDHDGED